MLLGGFCGVVGGIGLLLTLPGKGLPTISLVGAFALMGLGLGAASVASTMAGTAAVKAASGA
jgi:hypothetical protein